MSNYKDIIPKEFYRSDHEPVIVETVGELKDALQKLPNDLPIEQGFYDGCRLVVYNIKQSDVHLSFEEIDDD